MSLPGTPANWAKARDLSVKVQTFHEGSVARVQTLAWKVNAFELYFISSGDLSSYWKFSTYWKFLMNWKFRPTGSFQSPGSFDLLKVFSQLEVFDTLEMSAYWKISQMAL